tara:strand:- start:1303 stop:2541 length:1239 start_codon:yes stop_codon:yes gene_type:complete
MANNALIQGAALTGKKFLDVAGAVKKGLVDSGSFSRQSTSRVDENKAIQSRVNNYMSNMKTDMDFTSFSPEETATMRSFLLGQRSIYAEAAKNAASFDDTTDPDYMLYVDQMQSVNNSFTNLASQLKSYKAGKLDYAQNQLNGLYSNGNDPGVNNNAATIFGFADKDKDKRADKGVNSPFKVLAGGNLGFDIDGQEVSYNDMPMPGLKDNKLANDILSKNETVYNSGLRGGELNPEMLKAYRVNLDDQLQNRDALRSIVFDYESELGMFTKDQEDELSLALKSGTISYDNLRKTVVDKLVQARRDVFNSGKGIYNAKQIENGNDSGFTLSSKQISDNTDATETLNSWMIDDTVNQNPKIFGFTVRSPQSRATQTKETYEIRKLKDKYFLISNGRPEPLTTELAKEMFNIDLK